MKDVLLFKQPLILLMVPITFALTVTMFLLIRITPQYRGKFSILTRPDILFARC